MNEVVPSLSDIAAVCGNKNGNNGFGDGNGWWIILLFLVFGAWGRNGNGFGGSNSGAADNYVLASDFANISRQIDSTAATTERKLDSISNGICSLGYDQLRELNGINTNIMNNGYETRLGVNNLGSQLATCCCDIRQQISDCCCQNLRGLDNINYNLSQNTCTITNAINSGIRDIIDNQNCNYRSLHDEIVNFRYEDLKNENQRLRDMNGRLELSASQSRQNAYLLGELRNGCPINAQLVCGNNPIPVQYVGAGCPCNNNYGVY